MKLVWLTARVRATPMPAVLKRWWWRSAWSKLVMPRGGLAAVFARGWYAVARAAPAG